MRIPLMKSFSPSKYSNNQVDQAKRLYMSFTPVAQIARETDIPRSTLRYYIGQSWKDEREQDSMELITNIVGARKYQLQDISNLTLEVIFNSIRDIRESDKTMNTKAMLDLAKTLEILDRLAYADKRNNPDGLGDNEHNLIEMEEVEASDPFAPKELNSKESTDEN